VTARLCGALAGRMGDNTDRRTSDDDVMERTSSAPPDKVVILQTVVPDYRGPFFEELRKHVSGDVELLAGDEDWQTDIVHARGSADVRLGNVFLLGRRLLWQVGAIRPLLRADVAVVSLNPRVLTGWIVLVSRGVMRRRTVVWGHAWPRKGRGRRSDALRAVMRRSASTLVVYTETEARQVAQDSPKVKVVAAPNALYRRSEIGPTETVEPPTDVVYVGRLTPSKHVDLLVDAFVSAEAELPEDTRLVIVGDGPLRETLEVRARASSRPTRILFAGHVSSVDDVRAIYANAVVSVSPGPVGLSLIQSLGFGVPMILARDADHGPESEAAADGENVVMFSPTARDALARALVDVLGRRDEWLARRQSIADPIRDTYSIERMAALFAAALGLPTRGAPAPSATARSTASSQVPQP
jgi:glycosyltransferase involved in cell wall biosynthesis